MNTQSELERLATLLNGYAYLMPASMEEQSRDLYAVEKELRALAAQPVAGDEGE